ncbi:hypothetical protein Sgleb_24620 [Streptomyces glebosus]|uniref:Uncharacterized protein n=1 Tax=Streptomyces glebosus TaxID=249580 RepID=A0A640SYC6_9ACTN|nr:hypothetical protein Sgleb_24620 [Streptomyces glebosus]GHG55361.1 hypothetical protein GCM10010513_17450 [Streptomyces glebosus]
MWHPEGPHTVARSVPNMLSVALYGKSTFPCHLPPSPDMKLSPSEMTAVGFAVRPPGPFGAAEEWVGDTARTVDRIAVTDAAVIVLRRMRNPGPECRWLPELVACMTSPRPELFLGESSFCCFRAVAQHC